MRPAADRLTPLIRNSKTISLMVRKPFLRCQRHLLLVNVSGDSVALCMRTYVASEEAAEYDRKFTRCDRQQII